MGANKKQYFFNEIEHQFSEDSFPYNGFQISAHKMAFSN